MSFIRNLVLAMAFLFGTPSFFFTTMSPTFLGVSLANVIKPGAEDGLEQTGTVDGGVMSGGGGEVSRKGRGW